MSIRAWQLNAEDEQLSAAAGDAFEVCAERPFLRPACLAGVACGFLRAMQRCLHVMASGGPLVVDGAVVPGGIAVLPAGQHSIRIGTIRILTGFQTAQTGRCVDGRRCALSDDLLQAGDEVYECACGVVLLRGFAVEFSPDCPRCGRALPEWKEAD